MGGALVLVIRRSLAAPVMLLLVSAPASRAAVVEMSTSLPGCGGHVSETSVCAAAQGQVVDVTWALQAPETLNGYDFEVRWDPGELTLLSATQLFPDTGAPDPFSEAPSDPADSRAAVFSITAGETTALFRLGFSVDPGSDRAPDLWWFPNSDGLAPPSVILENSAGAAIDFVTPSSVPVLNGVGVAVLGALLLWCGGRVLRPRG